MASKIAGEQQYSMTKLCESRTVRKSHAIFGDALHPLQGTIIMDCPCTKIFYILQYSSVKYIFVISQLSFYIYGSDSVVVKGMWFEAGNGNIVPWEDDVCNVL